MECNYLSLPKIPASGAKVLISNTHIIWWFNTLRPRQNGRRFAGDIFTCILLNENVWISIKILLKFVLKSPINNVPELVQIKAWHRPGDKPLSEPMMVDLLVHVCVTLPQWVKKKCNSFAKALELCRFCIKPSNSYVTDTQQKFSTYEVTLESFQGHNFRIKENSVWSKFHDLQSLFLSLTSWHFS